MVRKGAMRVLVVMGLLLTAGGCSLTDDSGDVPDLVVAASLELTGSNLEVGAAHQNALLLKAEQINASGVLGKRKLKVVTRDNQSKTDVTESQVTDFAGDSTVTAIVTGACNACGVAAAKIANTKKVPLISLASAAEITALQTGVDSYTFKVGPNSVDNSRALATEAMRDLDKTKAAKIGLLRPSDAYGTKVNDNVSNALGIGQNQGQGQGQNQGQAPSPVLIDGSFSPDGSNLKDVARNVVAGKPERVLVWALPEQAKQAADALKAAGYNGSIYYDGASAGSLFVNASIEGSTLVFPQTLAMDDVIATTPAKAARKQWFEDYTARYGAYHGQASFAADALDLIVAAVNKAGTNRTAVRGVLASTEIDGLSGPLRITPANHSSLMPQALAVFVARGGRWRLLG